MLWRLLIFREQNNRATKKLTIQQYDRFLNDCLMIMFIIMKEEATIFLCNNIAQYWNTNFFFYIHIMYYYYYHSSFL